METYKDTDEILKEIFYQASRTSLGETTIPYLYWKNIVAIIKDAPIADVVPKSEVERLNKELDELAEEHSDLIIEKDKLFDIAEKQKVEIEALRIANEKMYSASKEAQNEVDNLEYENKLVFDEGEAWHRVADRYAKKLTELNVELQAMRGAANSYKMYHENLAKEIFAEIEKILDDCTVVRSFDYGKAYFAMSKFKSNFSELKKKYTGGST